ncbi:MAG: hypothetical protein SOY68_07495 [Fusobacterium varium]|jgi:DNA-directed RNA polymerase specialized sigma subunit|uniref:hypothetical protein n=1 Tax=Fusobacterium varium TaxID=856 RepID=UPI001898D8D7|nr:hypothetical protein [Fusobacterium varium]MCI6034248.1 hypothetical protein [Fusobacterium varium]MDY4005739.1 hypothetical protein [Fusobacterium varium]DAK06658.1 MAG TPA: repressor [Caudoviricetes sp.]
MEKEIKNKIRDKNKKIYQKLNIARHSQEKTFEEIAKELGVTTSTVFAKFKKLKSGKSVKTEFLIRLEDYFDVKIFFDL